MNGECAPAAHSQDARRTPATNSVLTNVLSRTKRELPCAMKQTLRPHLCKKKENATSIKRTCRAPRTPPAEIPTTWWRIICVTSGVPCMRIHVHTHSHQDGHQKRATRAVRQTVPHLDRSKRSAERPALVRTLLASRRCMAAARHRDWTRQRSYAHETRCMMSTRRLNFRAISLSNLLVDSGVRSQQFCLAH